MLNGWGLAENSMRPTIDIGLRPDIYEAFLAAFTSPNDGHPGHIPPSSCHPVAPNLLMGLRRILRGHARWGHAFRLGPAPTGCRDLEPMELRNVS